MIIASSFLSLFIALQASALETPSSDLVEVSPSQMLGVNGASPSVVSDGPLVQLNSEELLGKINERMAETKSARGGFTQTDALGEVTTGDFYLRRPGRVRFEYAAPTPYLIVSDGSTVAIEDKSLETIDRVPLSSTPLKHFLKKNLDLAEDTNILDVRSLPDSLLVVIEDNPKNGEDALDGMVFLKFDKDTYDLIGWVSIDGLGNETRVDLIDMEQNIKIAPRYFILEDDDDRDRR